MDNRLWVSLIVVAVALSLLSFRRARNADGAAKSPFAQEGWTMIRLIAGADNRDSTSKTAVLGWTSIVAWVVISTVLLSKGDYDKFHGLMASWPYGV